MNTGVKCWRHKGILHRTAPCQDQRPSLHFAISELEALVAKGNFPHSDSTAPSTFTYTAMKTLLRPFPMTTNWSLVSGHQQKDQDTHSQSKDESSQPTPINARLAPKHSGWSCRRPLKTYVLPTMQQTLSPISFEKGERRCHINQFGPHHTGSDANGTSTVI